MHNPSRLALAALVALAAWNGAVAQQIPPETTKKIDSAVAERFGVLCVLKASRDAIMGFSQPMKVSEVVIRGGQEVSKGQVIIRGDDAEEQAMLRIQKLTSDSDIPVESARKQRDLAELEHKRNQEAFAKGGAGQQEVERAKLQWEVGELNFQKAVLDKTREVIQLERMQARVDRSRIDAPFDGVVDSVNVDVGQSVSENEKLVRVVNVDVLKVDVGADIGDPKTWSVKLGDTAWVLVDIAGVAKVRTATVREVAPTADLGSRTRRVQVELPNPKGAERLMPGGPAWVRFSEPAGDLLTAVGAGAVDRALAEKAPGK